MRLESFQVKPQADVGYEATAVFRVKDVSPGRGDIPIQSMRLAFTKSSPSLEDAGKWLEQLQALLAEGVTTKAAPVYESDY